MKILPLRGSSGVLVNGGVVSPACTDRQSSTRLTPMLSSVQPVTATEPERIVVSDGVSTTPNGGDFGAEDGVTASVTATALALLLAPVTVMLMAPLVVPSAATVASNRTPTDSTAE